MKERKNLSKHLIFYIRPKVQFIISLLAKFLHEKVFYSTVFIFLFSLKRHVFMKSTHTKQNKSGEGKVSIAYYS